ncbi:MAG: diaminopimelate epimerase [Bacteroidota bacterium]
MQFYKYQGTGNDFVVIDQRQHQYLQLSDTDKVAFLCDRRFGVGADGVILLQHKAGYDFEMIYFNADGKPGSMCGNGGRCIVAFAKYLGIFDTSCRFLAYDGPHDARIVGADWVELKMQDVHQIEAGEGHYILDTGSPHFVTFVEDVDDINVAEQGAQIRYSQRFREKGINVNFVESVENGLIVATYERGVEDETLSCGTGVTAAALAHARQHAPDSNRIGIQAKGGQLEVKYERVENGFENIWLCGPATQVFVGDMEI